MLSPERPDTVDLVTVLRILRAQWLIVLVCLGLFAGAAVAYAVLTPKVWRASARVLLDPREKQLVGEDVARQSQGVDPGWVATRLELVKSYDTLAAVVRKENLVDDDEVYGAAAKAKSSEDPVAGAVRALSEMVLVERPKENDLIDVTVSSKSPEKAARLANAVARAFVDGLVHAKVEQIEHANALLSRQVEEMRSKMLEAEERVEAYKRDHGIAVTRGNLVEEETLRQANEALGAARTRMQEARERSERLAKALAGGDPAILSQNDPVGAAVISRLKIEAAMADRRKADLEQTLGPRHPRVAAAAAEAARARAQILDEVKSLAATADLDYQVARANDENARKAVERAQANLADVSQAVVGLQEMQNEASARRELYKSFVSRMEETTLQRNTQVSDGRIVSPAQIPLRPFSPRGSLALALALVAGLGTGVSLALWRGRDLLRGGDDAPRLAPAPTVVEASVVEAPTVTETGPAGPVSQSAPRARDDAEPEPPAAPVALVAEPVAGSPVAAEAEAAVEAVPVEAPSEPQAEAAIDLADEPRDVAEAGEFRRVVFPLTLDRIARIGGEAAPGAGARALVETGEGTADRDGLDRLRRLADGLGGSAGVRVVFSNTVPTVLTAALALGLTRIAAAGRRAALVDLAHEEAALDPIFEAAPAEAPAELAGRDAWERIADGDLVLCRPLDPVVRGDPEGHPADVAEVVAELAGAVDTVVVHLGRQPTIGLLFDCADRADHVTVVIDEKDVASRRVGDEIEVMKGLLRRFDGVVVLEGEAAAGRAAPRRAAARSPRGDA